MSDFPEETQKDSLYILYMLELIDGTTKIARIQEGVDNKKVWKEHRTNLSIDEKEVVDWRRL